MKVIIIGGVAGGASCAARLRRMNETAEIMLVERGPYISYANCGLPYHVGDVIKDESSLLVANAESFGRQFKVDVRTACEAISISAGEHTVTLRDVATGRTSIHAYDKLVLSPGAVSVRPPLPGIDLPGIFQVRTVPDARRIREWVEQRLEGGNPQRRPRAVVVGGGFIGLEMLENLAQRGFEVTLVEMLDQVLPPLDVELARAVEAHVEHHGGHLVLGDGVAGFESSGRDTLTVRTKSGRALDADLVILALGVRPDTALARAAGLALGERGGIRVDHNMRTSDADIFGVGDAVEVDDFVTGEPSLIALAGPANRQGRIAADVIAGKNASYRGTQGTAIVGLFGAAVAWTGVTERTLLRRGDLDYEKLYLFPNSHAGYYPGATRITLKVIFRKSDGRLLGAQAFGQDNVDKRISSLAMALQMGATVYDLEEAEVCYAPQFGSAKDPVNFAGMAAANILRGDAPIAHWGQQEGAFVLDVRNRAELAGAAFVEAVNIPLPELRDRLDELPKDREIQVFCRSGQRSYVATRILLQNGFRAKSVSGGTLARELWGQRHKQSVIQSGPTTGFAAESGAGATAATPA